MSGSGRYADQALQRLADRLRERRCACVCGCKRHSHYRHCLRCCVDEHRAVVALLQRAAA